MTNQQKHYILNEQQREALARFVGSLQLPWGQTNPVMQILINLPEAPELNSKPARELAMDQPVRD